MYSIDRYGCRCEGRAGCAEGDAGRWFLRRVWRARHGGQVVDVWAALEGEGWGRCVGEPQTWELLVGEFAGPLLHRFT